MQYVGDYNGPTVEIPLAALASQDHALQRSEMNDSHLVVADSRHLHVVGESRFRPGDGRAVPADYLDVVRTVFDLWRLATCGEFGFSKLQQRSSRSLVTERGNCRP